MSEVAEVEYKCTDFYDAADEGGVMWNDPVLGIEWPTRTPILSTRDQIARASRRPSEHVRSL